MTDTERTGSRRGCLALGCLLPTVLMAGLLVGGVFAGRSYVRNHLDEWRSDAPLLDLAVTVFRLRDEVSSTSVTESIRGDTDPTRLPEEIVVVSGSDPIVSISEDTVMVYQEADRSPAVIEQDLNQDLDRSGWELDEVSNTPGGRSLVWSSSDRRCTYQVVAGETAVTEVWIRCTSGLRTEGDPSADHASP